jgi:condensin complex subunit 1
VAEQAINAIYLLASQPDVLCGNIIKEKTLSVFRRDSKIGEMSDSAETDGSEVKGLSSVRSLSQLLFIVGHVASESRREANSD